ncbi:hypothetical protein GGH92_010296, partial [Coemansia sp. RSA 2673]
LSNLRLATQLSSQKDPQIRALADMGIPQLGGYKPTARIYKLGLLLAAALTVCATLWMLSSSLSSVSSSFVNGIKGSKGHNNNNHHHNGFNPATANDDDLLVGRLPAARISYDQPAEGERVNAAIIALVRNSELDGLRKSIR